MDTTDWESLFAQIAQRHSVRRYLDKPIEEEKLALLRTAAQQYNQDGGLNLRILDHDDRAFSGLLKVWFRGVRNYIVCAGPAAPDLEERCGYYGERLVLLSQRLGLNTCWAGMAKGGRLVAGTLPDGSAYVISIALGYGAEEGKAHKSKPLTELAQAMSADGGELP
jgi:nitroreductase